jgi:hypothetical protein
MSLIATRRFECLVVSEEDDSHRTTPEPRENSVDASDHGASRGACGFSTGSDRIV